MKLSLLSFFCVALCPSLAWGLIFDPFRSFLLDLQRSSGNETLEKEHETNQTWMDSFHKIISDTGITTEEPTTKGKVSVVVGEVVTIPSASQSRAVALLREKLNKFVSVTLAPDYKFLNETEKRVMINLIKAASLMDPIFERQVWVGNPKRMKELADQDSSLSRLQLEYMDIMRGPWDRNNNDKPFAIDREKPVGAGFYPEDMTERQFQFYVGSNPDKKEILESPVTLVKRNEVAAVYPVPLYGVPYSVDYEEWLVPASIHLRQAANETNNESLKKFLSSRADAFNTNDYLESDKDWLTIDSRLQTAIGPYRVVEDKLQGLKASFEAIVYILEQSFNPKFRTLLPETETEYAELIPELEADLPVPEEVKNKSPTKTSIHVAELVFAAGNARKCPQLFSYSFPSNPSVVAEHGQRKIVLSNVIYAFYNNILTKISEKIMKKKQLQLLDEDAFFMIVLYHEISHSIGPVFVGNDKAKGTLKEVLGTSHAPLEEAKAGVLGAYNLLRKIEKQPGFAPDFKNKVLFTYITSLLQLVRDGASRPEGKGAAIQLNRYLEDGSIVLLENPNPDAGRYQVNFRKLEISLNKLVGDIIVLQHKGEKDAANQMVEKYGNLGSNLIEVKETLDDIPVDIRPIFKDVDTY